MAAIKGITTADLELQAGLPRAATWWGKSYNVAATAATHTGAYGNYFYRGSALAYTLNDDATATASTNRGCLIRIPLAANQTQPLRFAGVNVLNPNSPDKLTTAVGAGTRIGFAREGLFAFWPTEVSVAGAATLATPDDTWIGRRVFFHSDQDVGLVPPDTDYPISAGRVVAYAGYGSDGYLGAHTHIPAGMVLVDIGQGVNWNANWYCPFSFACQHDSTDLIGDHTSSGHTFKSYTYLREMVFVYTTATNGSMLWNVGHYRGTTLTTIALGEAHTVAIAVPKAVKANVFYRPGDKFMFWAATSSDSTGVGRAFLRCLDCD